MNHLLITGGGEYLPFALSQVRRLRAAGINFASRNWSLPTATLNVRVVGADAFITLSSNGLSAYGFTPDITPSLGNHREPIAAGEVASIDGIDYPDPPVYEPFPPFVSTTGPGPDYYDEVYGHPFLMNTVVGATVDRYLRTRAGTLIGSYIAGVYSDWPVNYNASVNQRADIFVVYTVIADPSDDATHITWDVQLNTGTVPFPAVPSRANGSDPGVSYTTDGNYPVNPAYSADVATWVAASTAEYAAYLADLAVHNAAYDAEYAAWQAEVDALNADHLEELAAAQEVICEAWRPGVTTQRATNRAIQQAMVTLEVDQGLRTGYLARAAMTLPKTPNLAHTVPTPISEQHRSGSAGGEAMTYRITDYRVDPPFSRNVFGTVTSTSIAGNEDSCNANITLYTLTNCWVGGLPTGISPDMLPYTDRVGGYFVSGTIVPSQPWLQNLTFTVPPEYEAFLQLSMKPVADVIAPHYADDAFTPLTMSLVVFELEVFDRFTGLWVWTSTPALFDIDPIRVCGTNPCSLPAVAAPDATSPRAVRFHKLLKHRRVGGVWSTATVVESDSTFNQALPAMTALPTMFAISQTGTRSIAPLEPDAGDAILFNGFPNGAALAEVRATPWAGLDTPEKLVQKLLLEAVDIAGLTITLPEAP